MAARMRVHLFPLFNNHSISSLRIGEYVIEIVDVRVVAIVVFVDPHLRERGHVLAGWAGVVVASFVAVEMLTSVTGVGRRVVVVAGVGQRCVDVSVFVVFGRAQPRLAFSVD